VVVESDLGEMKLLMMPHERKSLLSVIGAEVMMLPALA